MKNRLFILILCAALVPSKACGQRLLSNEDLKLEDYAYQHPKNKFKFAKRKYIERLKAISPMPIDTNAVYITGHFNSMVKDTTYLFYRFFTNGEVFISYEYISMPSETECNDLLYGNYGMYYVNENNLIVEVHVLHDFVAYHYNYAIIDPYSNLIFHKRKLGKWGGSKMAINYSLIKKRIYLSNFTIKWDH